MRVNSQAVGAGGMLNLAGGTFIRLLSCPNAVTVTLLDSGQPIAEFANVTTGLAYESRDEKGMLRPFTSVKIENPTAQTIQYAVGYGELRYDVSNGTVGITKGATLSTAADVPLDATATTVIVAANAGRRCVLITNLAANAQTLRIGDANAGAARGIPLSPGETITLETTAAIYGYNPGGAAQSVCVLQESD